MNLKVLISDDFQDKLWRSTYNTYEWCIRQSEEYHELLKAYQAGEVTFEQIGEFVQEILLDFKTGVPFVHEGALATFAILFREVPSADADKYLQDLGKLDSSELIFATGIARKYNEQKDKETI